MNRFSYSSLSQLNKCPASYYWRYVRGLILDGVPIKNIVAMKWGSATHLSLEILYKGGSEVEAQQEFETYFKPYEGVDDLYTIERGQEYITKYIKYYFPEEFKIISVEKKYVIPVEDNINGVFKIDLVIEDKKGICPVDHKTTKTPSGILFQPNNQFTGYIWGVGEVLNTSVNRAIINIIGVCKGIRKKIEDGWSRPSTTRSNVELDNWKKWFIDSAKTAQRYNRENHWPQWDTSCKIYGRECPYLDLCNCDNEIVREKLIAGLYSMEERH